MVREVRQERPVSVPSPWLAVKTPPKEREAVTPCTTLEVLQMFTALLLLPVIKGNKQHLRDCSPLKGSINARAGPQERNTHKVVARCLTQDTRLPSNVGVCRMCASYGVRNAQTINFKIQAMPQVSR